MKSERHIDDVNIVKVKPLIPPAILIEELPLTSQQVDLVYSTRRAIERIISKQDSRLLIIAGPCSIHDTVAGLEYAKRLASLRAIVKDKIELIMRVYFEKPRTRVGWKGLINDPDISGEFRINEGLRLSRGFIRNVLAEGVPVGCEFLDTITPQFIGDCVSWGAIGARTTESQVHRELASGISAPIAFKNGTDGNVDIAIDAIVVARGKHHFLSVTKQGMAAIVETKGNSFGHLVLRGSSKAPNYSRDQVLEACKKLISANLTPHLMIDCSHGNSGKDFRKQSVAFNSIIDQVLGGERNIFGAMLESNIHEGSQPEGKLNTLKYGVSITDSCISWEETRDLILKLHSSLS